MRKKISITKSCVFILLLCALIFGSTGIVLGAHADEKYVTSVTIEIDYGDYDGNDLPKGKTGKSYPVFGYVATDNGGAAVSDVRVTVRNPDGEIVPQHGDRFETATAGEYSIIYVAVSGIVSAEKTVKVNVEEYTDTIVYSSEHEGVPETAETGDVVIANLGSFSGGVGDLTFETELKFGETNVDFTETVRGIYFVPEKCGEYTLIYSACDFVADKKSTTRTIAVSDSEIPVMQKPSLPASAIGGETITLPLPDGVLYRNGEKYYVPVSVYYDETEVGADMQVKNLAVGEHTVKYVCVNPLDSAKKAEYTFNLTVKDKNQPEGARLFDNYFDFENCEPITGDKKEYIVRMDKTDRAAFAFSRAIPLDYLNFDISTKSGLSAYSSVYMVLTDGKNAADCVKIKIKRLSSYENLWLAYDDETRSLIDSENGTVLEEIVSYTDGRTFEGFRSGKAFVSFEVENVKKQMEFTLRKIASNIITTDSFDYASPVFIANNDYRAVYVSYIGHSVYLPELKAFDLLDNNPTVTLTLYDENGVIYQGKGGYTFNITKSGEYMAEYTATDSNGNAKPQISTIYVSDQVSPVINVSGVKTTVKVGEEISLPKAEITDNDTPADKITAYIYVIKGNYQKKLISETYKFEEAGEYVIRYVAYDKNQNYTVVEFTVICKSGK